MRTADGNARVECPAILIPARPQTLWKAPAVGNFFLGGLGAGFYLIAAVFAGFRESPALSVASWLGPALVGAGFGAVALEAGRPLRGARVIARVATSWMSRELVIGTGFMALAAAELVRPAPALRVLAALAAVGLVLAQGFILRRAPGVAAWNVPVMPTVFLASAALSGLGLFLLVEVLSGRMPGTLVLGPALPLLAIGLVVWRRYLTWTKEAAFVAGTAALRAGPSSVAIVSVGYVLPFVAGGLAVPLRDQAPLLVIVAAALMIGGQARAKWALLREAGYLRPIAVPNLTLRGASERRGSASAHPGRSS